MPFYGNATTAPTAFSRIHALVVDTPNIPTGVLTIRGTLAASNGGQYEFDLGSGFIRRASHSADLTADATAAGPVIGGRDQAAAFTANTWVYLYALLKTQDLQTVGFILSANPPTTGPSGLSGLGYQSPVYCGAQRLLAGNAFVSFHRRNNITRQSENTGSNPIVNVATNLVANTAVNCTAVAPPTATSIEVASLQSLISTTAAAQLCNITISDGTTNNDYGIISQVTQVLNQQIAFPGRFWVPWDGTNVYYIWGISGTRNNGQTQLAVCAYEENLV